MREGLRGWLNVFWLSLIAMLSSLDMQLIYMLVDPVKRDLSLSDAQIGIITGSAVAVVMALGAFPIGWAADRFGRRLVLGCCIAFWSAMTLLCGLVESFEGFLLASVGLALGEAGLFGIAYALIPDIVSDRHRNAANTTLIGVLLISGAVGLILGGQFLAFIEAQAFAGVTPWRIIFIIAGAIGLPCALLPLLIRPLRAQISRQKAEVPGFQHDFGTYLRQHGAVVLTVFLAISFFASASSVWLIWSPSLYLRMFDAAPAEAGQMVGWSNLAGCIIAIVLANFLHSWFYLKLGDRFPIRILVGGSLAALLPIVVILSTSNAAVFAFAFAGEIACLMLAVSIAPMLFQDIAPPALRSRVIALVSIVGLPARMTATAGVGVLSDRIGDGGLLWAVSLVSGACLLVGVLFLLMMERSYVSLVSSVRGSAVKSPIDTATDKQLRTEL